MSAELLQLDPASLKPHPKNSRTHGETQIADIAKSINEYGFVKPIVIDESDTILAGHGAVLAALRMELPTVPCVRHVGLTDEQKRGYLIADNRLAELSKWDRDALAAELTALKGVSFDFMQPAQLFAGDRQLGSLLGLTLEGKGDEIDLFSRYSPQEIVDDAFAFYREKGFPYKNVAVHVAKQSLNKLAATQGAALLTSRLCYDVADSYHPHRFHGHADGKRSPVDSFGRDKSLRRALELQLEQHGDIPSGWFGTLALVLSTQACANFRPGFAAMLYRRYAKEGCTVLDTSTGYGGRMLGFMAAFKRGHYIGIDPSTQTHECNVRMAADLGFADRVTLINKPAEDVGSIGRKVDFCFTSPPYFGKEHYTDEPTQSRLRYGDIDAWVRGFLVPTLTLQHDSLKRGGYALVNIADVTIRNKRYPLAELTKQAATEVGFTIEEDLAFPLNHRMGSNQTDDADAVEPVLVFRR
jgi:hypothetical protein